MTADEKPGTAEMLGLTLPEANAAQRSIQKIASSGPGSWVFQRTLYPFDKLLFSRTNGKVTVPGILAGLPVIMLTTTGAKSGQERTMPLVGVPLESGGVAVIGSNYGQERTPGWVYNLEANPAARVSFRGRDLEVTARLASDAEADEAFAAAAPIYGGFSIYRERAAHREIRVFLLDPV